MNIKFLKRIECEIKVSRKINKYLYRTTKSVKINVNGYFTQGEVGSMF